jgi:hypothetical protein
LFGAGIVLRTTYTHTLAWVTASSKDVHRRQVCLSDVTVVSQWEAEQEDGESALHVVLGLESECCLSKRDGMPQARTRSRGCLNSSSS